MVFGAAVVVSAIGGAVVTLFGYAFLKGLYTGCIVNNAEAQTFINHDHKWFLVEPFELGVATANMAKYGSESLQFIRS